MMILLIEYKKSPPSRPPQLPQTCEETNEVVDRRKDNHKLAPEHDPLMKILPQPNDSRAGRSEVGGTTFLAVRIANPCDPDKTGSRFIKNLLVAVKVDK